MVSGSTKAFSLTPFDTAALSSPITGVYVLAQSLGYVAPTPTPSVAPTSTPTLTNPTTTPTNTATTPSTTKSTGVSTQLIMYGVIASVIIV